MKREEIRINKKPYLFLAFFAIVGALVVMKVTTVFSGTEDDLGKFNPNEVFTVSGVPIPDQITFAGEPVPLDLFDVRESLDRELLSNTYFHSQTIRLIKLANRYFLQIEPVLKKNLVPDDFKYLAMAESGFER